MTDLLKEDIKSTIAAIEHLASETEALSKRAISQIAKNEMSVGIELMDINKLLKQAKTHAEKAKWDLEKMS